MLSLWYVDDGEVEGYNGQDANWKNSVIVLAVNEEEALFKVMRYNQQQISRVKVFHNGHPVNAIV